MKVLLNLILIPLLACFSSSSNSHCFLPPQFCQDPPNESDKQTTQDAEQTLTPTFGITPDSDSDATGSVNIKSNFQIIIGESSSDNVITNKSLERTESL
jgi:hypothetical protein